MLSKIKINLKKIKKRKVEETKKKSTKILERGALCNKKK